LIIAYDIPGQLGNQLWAYSNLIAIGVDSKVPVVIAMQDDYVDMLDHASLIEGRKSKIYIYKYSSLKGKLIRKLSLFYANEKQPAFKKVIKALLPLTILSQATPASYRQITTNRNRLYLVSSWEHRSFKDAFLRKPAFIRSLLLPDGSSRMKAEKHIHDVRSRYKIIVAVHIRRGDYKDFLGGKYYYDDTVYLDKMQQIAALFPAGGAAFFIFSNEAIQLTHFPGLPVFFENDNTPVGDMWAMSLCDYITGPLSTFSMWASFWNKTPLLFMERDLQIRDTSMFRQVIAQDLQLEEPALKTTEL
jgi:hypothetical protein